MKKMKKLWALCLVLVMAVSVTACGNGGKDSKESQSAGEEKNSSEGQTDDASNENKESNGKKEKIIISCYLADDAQVAVRQNYLDQPLAEAFPDVDIEIKMYNDRQSLQVEVAGGGGPDILDLDGPTDVAEFAKADRVLDMGPYAEQYGWPDIFNDWAYNSCFYQGKLYSLPTCYEGMVMYYNMDVMNEHGWEIPKTAAELETLMKAMKDEGIIPVSFGNSDYQGAVDWLYSTFLSCNAGPQAVKDALEGTTAFSDPLLIDAMNQMVDWWKEGYIGDNASQSITTTDLLSFFAEGRAGMMINGTWASSQLTATYPDCNWTSEMVPELREGVGQILPFATGGGYAINANTKNPELCAEILNYIFTSMDRHYKSVAEASYQPYPVKAFDTAELEGMGMDEKLLAQLKVMDEAQENNQIGYCSWTFFPSDARVYMNENTDGLFLGTLTVEDFMKETQKYIDAAIADGSAPQLP